MCRSRAAFDLSSACREFSRSLRASSRVIWNGLGATVRLCAHGSGACFLAISSAVIFTSDLLLRIACSDVTRLMVARRMNSSLCMAIESDDPVSLLSGQWSTPMKNPTQHSQATIERMKANSEAAERRLARLNDEYRVRQEARKLSRFESRAKARNLRGSGSENRSRSTNRYLRHTRPA